MPLEQGVGIAEFRKNLVVGHIAFCRRCGSAE